MSARVRLADVARAAETTTTTVSLALNGRPGVSDATRERIVRLAKEMGYIPHQGARALARGRSGLWGAWVSGPEEIWSRWLAGVMTQTSMRLVVARLPSRERRRETIRLATAEGRLDGCLVFDPEGDDAGLQPLWESHLPTVVTGRRSNWFDCLEIHDRQALDHLLDHLSLGGRRGVALVATRAQLHRDDARIRAWHEHAHHVERDPPLYTVAEDAPEQGMHVATQLLGAAVRPEAVLCLSGDRTAVGILREARLRQISVPGELAVAGWGDVAFAAWIDPELTTVAIPWEDAGIRAALTLSRRFARFDLPRMHRTLDARAVIRRSG